MAQFGDLLAELRTDKKMTQKELAKIIKVLLTKKLSARQ